MRTSTIVAAFARMRAANRFPHSGECGYRSALSLAVLMILGVPDARAQEIPRKTLAHVRAVSVSIETSGRILGSGTLFHREGETFCLTAAHVVEQPVVRVVQYRRDKSIAVLAQVAARTPSEDVAILRLGKGVFTTGAHFYKDQRPPRLDGPIVHCGSMGGLHHTVARGWLVARDRSLPCPCDPCVCVPCRCRKILDQGDFTIYPGSSGGGVFLADGRYIGMAVRGIPGRIALFIPIRQMETMLKQDLGAEPKGAVEDGHAK